MRCSFCGRSGEDVRLFSGEARGEEERARVCEECVRAFRTELPVAGGPREQMAKRLRRGLQDRTFVRGLADHFVEYGEMVVREHDDGRFREMARLARRWRALIDSEPLDLDAAEVLRDDLEARRGEGTGWEQLAGHYETWLRGRKLCR